MTAWRGGKKNDTSFPVAQQLSVRGCFLKQKANRGNRAGSQSPGSQRETEASHDEKASGGQLARLAFSRHLRTSLKANFISGQKQDENDFEKKKKFNSSIHFQYPLVPAGVAGIFFFQSLITFFFFFPFATLIFFSVRPSL